MASPSAPLRRITRASLARFAYAGSDTGSTTTTEIKTTTPDIEDIIPSAVPASATTKSTSRKRKRTTVASTPQNKSHVKLEAEQLDSTALTSIPSPSPRRARKPARRTQDPATGTETVAAPSDWRELYDAAKEMRLPGGAAANAAVDTMGCERLALPTASPRDQRFHTLVALMLSSQTKDTTNAVAMRRLQTELPPFEEGAPPGLNLENMLAVAPEKLNELIWAVGFHNNKTKYLKQAAVILRDEWAGDIPDSIEGLVSLPGVGPKMAHLCLSSAWGRTEGIGVDVHVHRITNLWGWHKTKTPEETRLALQSWLPKDRWREINWLLVGLGQTVCAPVGRKCGDCNLGLDGLCKAADRAKVNQGRKLREAKVEVKEDVKTVKVEEALEDAAVGVVGAVELVEERQEVEDESKPPSRRRGKRG
ncbi:dna repair protein ntg1 [Diaporthe amygdali]|uniref:dna repair protein ntg1 n=1 Tax=Phomopsis amygdali TaxID=1214568 RepID=UPI0022FDD56A|nr:dna repair protein ntg1 [Diaporthe amygdali]KAJ0115170.1 dna repair protein ntg1 [Diaporthe amygdali]